MRSALRLGLVAGLVLSGALALGACREKPKLDPGATPTSTVPARTWPKDAPVNDATCTKHDECAMIVWDGPSPPDPCCDSRMGYVPVRRSYLDWFTAYRKESCSGVTCPPSPLPGAEPIQCARVSRCVGGKCTRACDDPSYAGR